MSGRKPATLQPPLSELRGEPVSLQRHYEHTPDRQARIEGDEHLLVLLSQERQRRQPYAAPWLTVGEMPKDVLQAIVRQVEELHRGSWRLEGSGIQSIVVQLDEHFAPLQAAAAEQRRQTEELNERRRALDEANAPKRAAVAAENERRSLALWGVPIER